MFIERESMKKCFFNGEGRTSCPETMEKNWYVVHTYSGYENKVKANLEKRVESMGMQDKIFRVVVPEEEETDYKNGKKKVSMKKVFPGYVLVEIVMTDDSWYVVRNTPGVTGFVGSLAWFKTNSITCQRKSSSS